MYLSCDSGQLCSSNRICKLRPDRANRCAYDTNTLLPKEPRDGATDTKAWTVYMPSLSMHLSRSFHAPLLICTPFTGPRHQRTCLSQVKLPHPARASFGSTIRTSICCQAFLSQSDARVPSQPDKQVHTPWPTRLFMAAIPALPLETATRLCLPARQPNRRSRFSTMALTNTWRSLYQSLAKRASSLQI